MADVPQQRPRISENDLCELFNQHGHMLSVFKFDTARKIAEKFKTKVMTCAIEDQRNWLPLAEGLARIAMADKKFYQFTFLLPKKFFRKDDMLPKTYASISEDLGKAIAVGTVGTVQRHILEQTQNYVTSRLSLMAFYTLMANTADRDWDEMTRRCLREYDKSQTFSHPMLLQLANLYQDEVDVMYSFLKLECAIINAELVALALQIRDAREKLNNFLEKTGQKSMPKQTTFQKIFKSSTDANDEEIVHKSKFVIFLENFYEHLVAKAILYFSESFGPYTNPMDFDDLMLRPNLGTDSPNYIAFIQEFMNKRKDIVNIYIVMNRQSRDGPFHGFSHIDRENLFYREDVEPHDEYAVNYAVMIKFPIMFSPNTHSMAPQLELFHEEMAQVIKHGPRKMFNDTINFNTLYGERLEEDIHGVVIARGIKENPDQQLIGFLNDLALLVRGHRLFQAFKHGQHIR